ncbi:MAG: transcriptional regulator NrdR [Oscillospiraceae bacterium]|nr:transcriptional regulator NrdR [Oscillospiraceae bacterium]
MKCPFCGFLESKVVDSRPTEEGGSIRRRRECLKCAKRFTTYETIESLPLLVIKKDGTRQSFARAKLLNSLLSACDKRSVTLKQLEELVTDIEQYLLNSLEREIPSSKLGDYVMERLRVVDEVAYVRFASVYRQFKDVSTFLTEVDKLLNAREP